MRKTALLIGAVLLCLLTSTAATFAQCVALTFDDGPSPMTTPKLLDILKREGVKATFFVIGENVRRWPGIVRAAHADGHEIGNHTWDHPWLTTLSDDDARSQIVRADAAIKAATGTAPRLIRAPYGDLNRHVEGLFPGRPFIGWSVETKDYKLKNAALVTHAALASDGGGIVVMHDIHLTTVNAVPGIIMGYRVRGFRFVTVSEFRSSACAVAKSAKAKVH